MKRIKLLLTLLIITAVTSLRADPFYVVPPDTPDHTPGDFLSWATAATNIQDAVTAAGTSGATVWVSNGTYRLSAQITIGNLKLRSWPDGLTNRDTTIIDGNYPNTTNRCFVLNNAAALVEGFTITNGYRITTSTSSNYDGGGGVYINGGGTLRNCLVIGNRTENPTGADNLTYGGGGGVAVRSSGLVDNCDILYNESLTSRGGGVVITGNAKIKNSRVKYNHMFGGGIYDGGGGVAIIGGNMTGNHGIHNCVISDNISDGQGGGVFIRAHGHMRNSLVARNTATHGGGIYQVLRGTLIESSTITANTASTGGGVYQQYQVQSSPNPKHHMWNSIVYGNSGTQIHVAGSSGHIDMYYTLVSSTSGAVNDIDGNITDQSPRFANPDADNYRLSGGSPCIDAGTNQLWMVDATDLAGNARIGNQVVDIGAYEYIPRGIMIMFK